MTSEQPDTYASCENENNQNVVFLPSSERFWIKFDLCLKISFHEKKKKKKKRILNKNSAKN